MQRLIILITGLAILAVRINFVWAVKCYACKPVVKMSGKEPKSPSPASTLTKKELEEWNNWWNTSTPCEGGSSTNNSKTKGNEKKHPQIECSKGCLEEHFKDLVIQYNDGKFNVSWTGNSLSCFYPGNTVNALRSQECGETFFESELVEMYHPTIGYLKGEMTGYRRSCSCRKNLCNQSRTKGKHSKVTVALLSTLSFLFNSGWAFL